MFLRREQPSGHQPSTRCGVTVVEVLVSLLLGLVVISLGWSALAHQRTVASRLRSELDLLSARRLAAIVIGKELRAGVRGRDWVVRAPGLLALRAFRGWGPVCGFGTEPGDIVVAYHGERAANPVKDSVLILTADGWQPADLTRRAVAAGSCAMDLGGNSETWTHRSAHSGGVGGKNFRTRELSRQRRSPAVSPRVGRPAASDAGCIR